MLANALAGGSGWVLLTYVPRDGRLINQSGADHGQNIAGGIPILALDMYEHAYHLDFGANVGAYVDAFMANIAWERVANRFAGNSSQKKPHTVDAPTALEVLKEAMDDHGEVTDADRKRAAEVSGLPEAAGYGVSTFYDDLLAPRGTRHVRVEPDGQITVDMGAPAVLGAGWASIGAITCEGLRISVGNPHLACVVESPLEDFDLSVPPSVDTELFPDGANVELVRLLGERSAQMLVYERGSGLTRSCGTGAVAAAVAAAQATGDQRGRWRVRVPGGDLTVTLAPDTSLLTGPAVLVAEGELSPEWLAA